MKLSKKAKKTIIAIAMILGSFVAGTVSKENPVLGKVIQEIVNTIGSSSQDTTSVTWQQN